MSAWNSDKNYSENARKNLHLTLERPKKRFLFSFLRAKKHPFHIYVPSANYASMGFHFWFSACIIADDVHEYHE